MALITDNLVAEYVAHLATGSGPGVNSPLTATWADLVGDNYITLNQGSGGFAGTAASGWAGAGTVSDPYCLVSDGDRDYATFASRPLTQDADFTVELWLYCPSVTDVNVMLFHSYTAGSQRSGLRCYLDAASDRITWGLADGGSEAYAQRNAPGYGSWQHHVFTYDAVTDVGTPYSDAVKGWTASGGFAPPTGTCYLFYTTPTLAGCRIATLRVYSTCLAAADVAANYSAGVLAASVDAPGGPPVPVIVHHLREQGVA